MKKNAKISQSDSDSSKIEVHEVDPIKDYNQNCKNHINSKDKYIFVCYDCKKFTCTKCYAKHHKKCFSNLVENFYTEMKSTTEANQKTLSEMVKEFKEEVNFMEEKLKYFNNNNPFKIDIKLIEKIYDNVIQILKNKKEEALNKMKTLEDNYLNNISQNLQKIKQMIKKSEELDKNLTLELKKMSKQTPFDYCKDMLKFNTTADLADQVNDVSLFSKLDFTRICQAFIDTNTIVYNDSKGIIEQSKAFREYAVEKVDNFFKNYTKYQTKNAYSVVMNNKQFLVFLIEKNKIAKINYINDFYIPCYSRWISLTGNKLLLTGGEKDYIESLPSCYLFKFKEDINGNFSAEVSQKADMINKRRAHSLIYFNDYVYAISGVDKIEMIKSCEKYDVFSNKWIKIPDLNFNRQNAALAIHNERYLYAFSGYDGFRNMNSYEKLDFTNEKKGWELVEFRDTLQDTEEIDIRKNRLGVIALDFDRVLIFGGERNGNEYKEAFIFEFYENKYYQFSDLMKNSNFIMEPIFWNGNYYIFDFMNNIHELNLETLQFEYREFHQIGEDMNL